MKTVVFGVSDDLIEVTGAVHTEIDPATGETYLAFSNGVVLWVKVADNGVWRISVVRKPGLVKITPARCDDTGDDADGCPDYSDKAVITPGAMGPVEWMLCGSDSGWAVAS